MLRAAVIGLLIANLLALLWTQGGLGERWASDPAALREPQRLAQQVGADRIRVLGPTRAAAASTPAVCLEAGPMGHADFTQQLRELQQAGVPTTAFVDTRRDVPGRWIIAMGPYPDAAQQQRKLEEVARLNLGLQSGIELPARLQPGLALGQYESYDAAARQLAQWQVQGLRSARIVQTAVPDTLHQLRIDHAERQRLDLLRAAAASAPQARAWRACGR
jgi:hypothetical protein